MILFLKAFSVAVGVGVGVILLIVWLTWALGAPTPVSLFGVVCGLIVGIVGTVALITGCVP